MLSSSTKTAVFHEGEIAIQRRIGVAEKMDRFGRMVIRDHMPQQHRDFYKKLPFIFAGHQDKAGHVWASILTGNGEEGFISSSNNKSLTMTTQPLTGDPLGDSLMSYNEHKPGLVELRLGILGIELHTRRRNRISVEVDSVENNKINFSVLQAFGNCPQYIQNREIVSGQTNTDLRTVGENRVTGFTEFSHDLSQFISNADTFFVASSTAKHNNTRDVTEGADVSHRGGRPGFIKVEQNNSLLIPDFTGNNHYNTLGNFEVNPKAGLLFIDFKTGDVITLTGKTEIVWEHESKRWFKGAERFWRFRLEKGFVLHNALPWRFKLNDVSPNNLMTGTWAEAEALRQQEQNKRKWHRFVVKKVKDESSNIRSFWFAPETGVKPDFKPGQHIALRAGIKGKIEARNYSVSNSPHDEYLRISVKRDGTFSNWLHDALSVGDVVELKHPLGSFTLTSPAEAGRQAILLSAGIGITPMVSMARHAFFESIRTRQPRSVLMVNTFRNAHEMAFVDEISRLSQDSDGAIRAIWLLTQPEPDAVQGQHYSAKGRLNKDILQQLLPLGRYDFYLCGPAGFMQDTYDLLLSLGVADTDIKTEAFGPSALKRKKSYADKSQSIAIKEIDVAESAVVTFDNSQVEQVWSKEDGNLLDFAESHGLTPEFGCRGGSCGSCKVNVLNGKVIHQGEPSAEVAEDEALLCCAVPAKSTNDKLVIAV